jgi:hypothetical protein
MDQSNQPLSPPILLLADTDATQAYVFESNKLPEIRGASRQLHDLNDRIGKMVTAAGGDLIYAGGGGLLALVEEETAAANLTASIEALYPQQTGAATITAVARPLPPTAQPDEFGEAVSWLTHVLRRRKTSKGAPPFWECLPYQTRCASCQKRPALFGQAGDWCAVCTAKRFYEGRLAWFRRFEAVIPRSHPYYKGRTEALEHPQDLQELGQVYVTEPGYIAFIYLDGDGIGQHLQGLQRREQYQAFSARMQEVTETAVFNALAAHLRVSEIKGSAARAEVGQPGLVNKSLWIHPFEIITIGGDDVMLIAPAHAALPIAAAIGRAFREELSPFARQKLGLEEPITMSGGVVLADDHTAVRMLRDLAGQLQDEAKKAGGDRLDFLVLKSADMLAASVGGVRDAYPYRLVGGDRRTGKDVRLLARPYTHAQVETLWEQLGELKGKRFANSQMHLLAEALLDGRSPATLFYEYQRQRSRHDRDAYERLHQLLTDLYDAGARDPLPWQVVSGDEEYSFQTALWDLAELYDFAPALEEEGHG